MLISLVGCTTVNEDKSSESTSAFETEVIESTLLWKAKIDDVTVDSTELEKLVRDEKKFKSSGDSYEALVEIYPFGGRVKGIWKMEYAEVPNVCIDASAQVVVDYIATKYHLELKYEDVYEEYQLEIGKDILLAVHPTQENESWVISGYLEQ